MGLNKDSQLGFQRTQQSRRKNAFNFKQTKVFICYYCSSPAGLLMYNSNVVYSRCIHLEISIRVLLLASCVTTVGWWYPTAGVCHKWTNMSVQFTAMSTFWNRPRWPFLWWSHSRPGSFRCHVAELTRSSSQTTREVRLEFSWGSKQMQIHIWRSLKPTFFKFSAWATMCLDSVEDGLLKMKSTGKYFKIISPFLYFYHDFHYNYVGSSTVFISCFSFFF